MAYKYAIFAKDNDKQSECIPEFISLSSLRDRTKRAFVFLRVRFFPHLDRILCIAWMLEHCIQIKYTFDLCRCCQSQTWHNEINAVRINADHVFLVLWVPQLCLQLSKFIITKKKQQILLLLFFHAFLFGTFLFSNVVVKTSLLFFFLNVCVFNALSFKSIIHLNIGFIFLSFFFFAKNMKYEVPSMIEHNAMGCDWDGANHSVKWKSALLPSNYFEAWTDFFGFANCLMIIFRSPIDCLSVWIAMHQRLAVSQFWESNAKYNNKFHHS